MVEANGSRVGGLSCRALPAGLANVNVAKGGNYGCIGNHASSRRRCPQHQCPSRCARLHSGFGCNVRSGVGVKPTGIGFTRRLSCVSGRFSQRQNDDERGAKTTQATGAVADCKCDVRCNDGFPLWAHWPTRRATSGGGKGRRHTCRSLHPFTCRGKVAREAAQLSTVFQCRRVLTSR